MDEIFVEHVLAYWVHFALGTEALDRCLNTPVGGSVALLRLGCARVHTVRMGSSFQKVSMVYHRRLESYSRIIDGSFFLKLCWRERCIYIVLLKTTRCVLARRHSGQHEIFGTAWSITSPLLLLGFFFFFFLDPTPTPGPSFV